MPIGILYVFGIKKPSLTGARALYSLFSLTGSSPSWAAIWFKKTIVVSPGISVISVKAAFDFASFFKKSTLEILSWPISIQPDCGEPIKSMAYLSITLKLKLRLAK